jgi:hypothetical protein
MLRDVVAIEDGDDTKEFSTKIRVKSTEQLEATNYRREEAWAFTLQSSGNVPLG